MLYICCLSHLTNFYLIWKFSQASLKKKEKKTLWKQIVYIAVSRLFILPISLFLDNWLLLLFFYLPYTQMNFNLKPYYTCISNEPKFKTIPAPHM